MAFQRLAGTSAADGPAALLRKDAVNSTVYSDPAIFELEMERLFDRSWLLVGHESQVPEPGDFVTARYGRKPVLIVRGNDGTIRVFYNRCTHRGAKLCMLAEGRQNRFVCPYHAWTFDSQGALRAIPKAEEYDEGFRHAGHDLKQIARTESYRGFLFAKATDCGPDLRDFLGHMTTSIDDIVDRAPGGRVTFSKPLRHRYKGNWKYMFENLNDTLHAGVAHAVAAKAAAKVIGTLDDPTEHPALLMMVANAKPLEDFEALDMVTAPNGHSYFGGHMGARYRGDLENDYFAALAAARGREKAEEILSVDRHLTLIYPASTWHGRYQTVRMVHPLRVDLTEVVSFVCRLDGAPEGVHENAITYCNNASSALSSVITDDLEIYEAAQRQSALLPGIWLPIVRAASRGRGAAPDHARHPATSEAYIRNQYAAWAAALGETA